MKVNNIMFVVDDSVSMRSVEDEVRTCFNELLIGLREPVEGQVNRVGVMTFASTSRVICPLVQASSVSPLTERNYSARGGSTALFDAAHDAIEACNREGPGFIGVDVANLVIVITDGKDNASYRCSPVKFRQLAHDLQARGDWTLVFQMPPGTGKEFSQRFGIPMDNIREWEQTTAGVKAAAAATSQGIARFTAARTSGAKQVSQFFVTTDLANLSTKTVHAKLDDVSDRFKVIEVKTEGAIKEVVELKTKKPYVLGAAYYQLTKPEKVQASKGVLLVEKGKGAVWAGEQARDMIGLPKGVEAKVTPGNHSTYDIFVQSTSPNRKLPRGTKLLVDKNHTKDSKPTWTAPVK